MRIFGWAKNHPDGLCDGALVAVACERATEAARLARKAGWNGVKPDDAMELVPDDDDDLAELLARPGVVRWRGEGEDYWRD